MKKNIIIIITIITALLIFLGSIIANEIIKQKRLNKMAYNMGKGAADFTAGIENAESYIDDFSYNYNTGEVEYHPNITLEMYNRINEGMSQDEVISILGNYDNKIDGDNSYVLEWGNAYSPVNDSHWIQIVLGSNTKTVLSKYQVGLQ